MQSLTAFSAGSSIHDYDNTLQGDWYRQLTPTTQNEARVQLDYSSFNVIPNVPAEVGIQIPSFINNLGSSVFLPSFSILRRYEFADNFTKIHRNHTFKFGAYELLRGTHAESHTYFPGRFVFGYAPRIFDQPRSFNHQHQPLASGIIPAAPSFTSKVSAIRPTPVLHAAADLVLRARLLEDHPKLYLSYGLRYDLDTQFAPLTTYKKSFAREFPPRGTPPNHKTVVRGGYGIFYGPVDVQIPSLFP